MSMITGKSPRGRIHRQSASPSIPGKHYVEHDELRRRLLDERARRVAVARDERLEPVR